MKDKLKLIWDACLIVCIFVLVVSAATTAYRNIVGFPLSGNTVDKVIVYSYSCVDKGLSIEQCQSIIK